MLKTYYMEDHFSEDFIYRMFRAELKSGLTLKQSKRKVRRIIFGLCLTKTDKLIVTLLVRKIYLLLKNDYTIYL